MLFWAKARRVWLAVLALVGLALTFPAGGELPFPIPQLLAGGPSLPMAFAMPVLPAIALAVCLATRGTGTEPSALRALARYDGALASGLLVFGVLACLTYGPVLGNRISLIAARNLVGYIGLVLLAGAFLSWQLAGVAPVAMVILSTMIGGGHTPYVWAWPIMSPSDPTGWVWVLLLAIAGFAALLRRVRPPAAHDTEAAI